MKILTYFLLFTFYMTSSLQASECQVLRASSKAPDQSVNIVLVPSNFNGDMELFRSEAQKIVKTFEAYKPFSIENRYLNFLLSNSEYKDNSYCEYGCSGIDRLLCCKRSAAKKLAKKCNNSPERQILVVHNDTKYGGAGYISDNIATTSINHLASKVAVHELGHSLFDLADEYKYSTSTRGLQNCAKSDCLPWNDLIQAGFEGATCTPNGCAGGEFFTCGETIMKTLSLNFGVNNERLACCKYKEITGNYPSFCEPYKSAGMGLNNFCSSKSLSKSNSHFSNDHVEFFDPSGSHSGFYKIKE